MSEIKVQGVIDEHEIIEQGKESAKVEAIQINKEFRESQNVVEEKLQEQDRDEKSRHCEEVRSKAKEFLSNPNIIVDETNGTFDPASLVGPTLTTEEKVKLIEMEPCQPNLQILKLGTKQFGERSRYCSKQVFFPDDDTRWK